MDWKLPAIGAAGLLGVLALTRKSSAKGAAPAPAPAPSPQPGPPAVVIPPTPGVPAPVVLIPNADIPLRGVRPPEPTLTPVTPPVVPVPAGLPPALQNVFPPNIVPVIKAKVTTNDPPPSGDLIVRGSASMTGPVLQGGWAANQTGGAEKDGIVTILNSNADPAGVFAEIQWDGGSRWPAIRGFVKKQYLKNV